MARLANALRLALGGATGALEGYGAKQERLRKDELLRQERERQAMLDAAALRAEERQAIASGMIPGERFNRMTMPGATPMEAALRQTIGGKEYVYAPEINAAEKHRAGVMKERGERKEKAEGEAALADVYGGLEVGGKRLFTPNVASRLPKLGANERSSFVSAAIRAATPRVERGGGKEELSDTEKRRRGLQFLSGQTFNPALTKALQSTFAVDPAMAEDPYMAVYDIMTSKTVKPITPMQRYKPPVEKTDKNDMVSRVIEKVKAGRAGATTPATTPTAAPAKAPTVTPATAPAAPQPPAQPSLADAAAKQASRADLWDKLKAQNPTMSDDEITARVMREIP